MINVSVSAGIYAVYPGTHWHFAFEYKFICASDVKRFANSVAIAIVAAVFDVVVVVVVTGKMPLKLNLN